ncbi:YggS family pyridoxal phosphate enzyme [Loa loa]|uniref:Pyridoxal phosphate homeostasis protein n=1 Tax=Loa loa TaxID=7209 RepID=A0A1I7VI65_LOALO|nr:YggS family pyridoxal phosphate enzyme [Loa loa]EFO27752.1 YggS family pyridoxal phosphate enzyme [Loa loa]
MAVRQVGDLCRDLGGIGEELNSGALVDNLQLVLRRIENASKKAEQSPYWRGQKPSLIAVSKTKSSSLIQCCYDAGQMKFGENYIQELADKAKTLKSKCPNIQWHFIGTIQSNKIAKLAEINNLSCVETICNKKHSSILEKEIAKHNRTLKVLVQVNTSKEKQKGGTTPEMAVELAEFIRVHCPSLKFSGFMTIGSFARNMSETPNRDFIELFKVRKTFCELTEENEENFELSMGMSNDFEAAIMLGSTSVRIGNAIFGHRLLKGE